MIILFLTVAASLAAESASTQSCRDPRTLIHFADAFDRAQLSKNARALDRMVAHNLIFIDGSGKRLGKSEFIKGWTSPGDTFDAVPLRDRRIVRLGPSAGIVTAEVLLAGKSGGQAFSSRLRFSDTFLCTAGSWRAVHIQVTRLAPIASSK